MSGQPDRNIRGDRVRKDGFDAAGDLAEVARADGQPEAELQHFPDGNTAVAGQLEVGSLQAESMDVVLGMSILHLVRDKEAVIAKVKRTLRPGGVFVSSTVCLGKGHWYLRPVLPVLRLFGLVPRVVFFTREQLEESLVNEGFEIEHSWQPSKGKAVFVVARKH